MSHIKEALFFAAEYGDAVKLKSLISKENKYVQYVGSLRTVRSRDCERCLSFPAVGAKYIC